MDQTRQPRDRRPDALGHLSVLPDELICVILEHLSSSDLVRLSCVSSVLYVLCNEEPLWMNLCLRDGGQFEYKGSWKRTTLYRQNLCIKIDECQRRPLHFDGFSSLFLYKRWYRCFTTLDGFTSDGKDLERRNNQSLEAFNNKIDEKKPVLLTEVASTWPARYKWTVDQLLSNYGDVSFRISQRSSKKITMKLKDYVSYMNCQHDEDPLYIFDDKFGEVAPALLQDYCVPSLFQEDFFDVLDYDQRPPFRWLIIGPERSGASWHVDPGLTSAWNTLLCGRKRWALYPPGRVPVGVTVHVSEDDGDINIESPSSLQWWLDIYPLLDDQDKPLECTQLPGETIFVPSGWWHCVLNLDTTVAVTQNFVNTSNFEFVCLDMAPGHVHKGVCRAGFLAVQDGVNEYLKNDASFEMNLLNYPDMSRREKRLKILEPFKEQNGQHNSWNSISGLSHAFKCYNQEFSYDINFLLMFLDKGIDHYNTICSPSNILGEREIRTWLHKLWVLKPTMRKLIWKGACLALNVEKWSACLMEICTHYNLPLPIDDEKFPVGTGSNPVFLISDYVIKIFVEGGLGSSLHCLGTELEFYSLLAKSNSPLMNHVPDIIESGFLVADGTGYRTFSWDGRAMPDMIANSSLVIRKYTADGFPFGIWSKKQFELENHGVNMCSRIWPFIVSKRCKGDILANLRYSLSKNEVFHLASFLGEQLRHLHLLPLPNIETHLKEISEERNIQEYSVGHNKLPVETDLMEADCKGFDTFKKWELLIALLDRRKKNIKNQLAQWGDPIPGFLIDEVEKYIPHDLSSLFDFRMGDDGSLECIPTWIHSDIMDDNIHMKQCCPFDCFNECSSHTSLKVNGSHDACGQGDTDSRMNGVNDPSDGENVVVMVNTTLSACNGITNLKRWCPSHILDFSDLSIGDPLYDLIPIYLDVFRGDMCLMAKLLEHYNLPLITSKLNHDELSSGLPENDKCKRLSYRAMCYCILHEDNVLGAIFSLWKELRTAKSWEEVEEAVWGGLNNYQHTDL
ncbi:F-box protein At1g78280 [Phalaenopsis equestris]|uniref:F-box protein At1g78280 n=1 Tax=Phalaenopsis equestris TaxID=78828 RepID=UPI0009E4E9BC|nr:F-box protein At1g78280 [Phalaenopsis equestris]